MDQTFLSKLEDAALNAWPAPRQMILDGWLLRFAKGYTKRSNSVNLRYESGLPLTEKIQMCEAVYTREGFPLIFRLPDPFTSQAVRVALNRAGYQAFDPTYVLGKALGRKHVIPGGIKMEEMTIDAWLELRAALTGTSLDDWSVHRDILGVIVPDKVLLGVYANGKPIACGMGVLEGEQLGYFSIFVSSEFRRRGYGQVTMWGITNWGLERGATFGYLQVEGDNEPALAMYQKMGFDLCYRYVYCKKP
jgi:GNAT superfamily N-acetyltransferase